MSCGAGGSDGRRRDASVRATGDALALVAGHRGGRLGRRAGPDADELADQAAKVFVGVTGGAEAGSVPPAVVARRGPNAAPSAGAGIHVAT